MVMAICPFCASGLAWNQCRCVGGLYAQRHGLRQARVLYPPAAANARRTPPVAAVGADQRTGYAPVGECEWCDANRRRAAERVTRHRAKKS